METVAKSNDIFISYRRADVEFTKKVHDGLKQADLTVWIDWNDIPPGVEGFSDEIQRGIEGAVAFICILSPTYLESEYCLMELKEALRLKKRVIPVVLKKFEPTPPPEGIGHINWVYFTPHAGQENTFEDAFPKVLQAIRADYEHSREHTKLLQRAIEWQKNEKGKGYVLKGTELEKAERWQAAAIGKDPAPTELHSDYILASRKEEKRRQRNTLTGVTVALIISIALGIVAFFQRQEAVRQAEIALARQWVAEAKSILSDPLGNPETAALLTLKSLKNGYSAQADEALVESISHLYTAYVFELGSQTDATVLPSVAFAPDGNTLAVANNMGDTSKVNLYESSSGNIIQSLETNDFTNSITFSPDGRQLAVAGSSGVAHLYRLPSGDFVQDFSGHEDEVSSVAFSSDGQYLLTGSWDDNARLWDLSTGDTTMVYSGHADDVLSVAFSADGNSVFTSSEDQNAYQWDLTTGTQINQASDYNSIPSISVSKDGKFLATVTDRKATIWDVSTYERIRPPSRHPNWVNSVAFSPDGKYYVTGGDDSIVRIWDTETGEMKRALVGHSGIIHSVAYSPDGTMVLTASEDGTARLWHADLTNTPRILYGHADTVNDVAVSPDGKTIATGSWDEDMSNHYKLWDAATGRETHPLIGHTWLSSGISFSKDGHFVLTANGDGTVRVWNVKTGESIQTIQVYPSWVNTAAFSPDGKYILAGGNENAATVWEVSTGTKTLELEHPDWVNSVAFSPDGKFAATGCRDNIVRLWDLDKKEVVREFEGHSAATDGGYLSIESVVFSPDGKYILSGSADGTARLWDINSGEMVKLFKHGGLVLSAAISSDGKYVLTGGADRLARLWDIQTGGLVRTFTGHTDSIFDTAFSQDGKFVVTASADTTVRIWDTDYMDTVRFVCSLLPRDFSEEELTEYHIPDTDPICSN